MYILLRLLELDPSLFLMLLFLKRSIWTSADAPPANKRPRFRMYKYTSNVEYERNRQSSISTFSEHTCPFPSFLFKEKMNFLESIIDIFLLCRIHITDVYTYLLYLFKNYAMLHSEHNILCV